MYGGGLRMVWSIYVHRNFNMPAFGKGLVDSLLGVPSACPDPIIPQSHPSASVKRTFVFTGTAMMLIEKQETMVYGSTSSRLRLSRSKIRHAWPVCS